MEKRPRRAQRLTLPAFFLATVVGCGVDSPTEGTPAREGVIATDVVALSSSSYEEAQIIGFDVSWTGTTFSPILTLSGTMTPLNANWEGGFWYRDLQTGYAANFVRPQQQPILDSRVDANFSTDGMTKPSGDFSRIYAIVKPGFGCASPQAVGYMFAQGFATGRYRAGIGIPWVPNAWEPDITRQTNGASPFVDCDGLEYPDPPTFPPGGGGGGVEEPPCDDQGVHAVVGDSVASIEGPPGGGCMQCDYVEYGIFVYYDYAWHLIDTFEVYECDDPIANFQSADAPHSGSAAPRAIDGERVIRMTVRDPSSPSDPEFGRFWAAVMGDEGEIEVRLNSAFVSPSMISLGVVGAEYLNAHGDLLDDPRGPLMLTALSASTVVPKWADDVAQQLRMEPVRTQSDASLAKEIWIELQSRRRVFPSQRPERELGPG